MNLDQRIEAFVKLGDLFKESINLLGEQDTDQKLENEFVLGFVHQIKLAKEQNPWFTRPNIIFALEQWSHALNKENLEKWTNNYGLKDFIPKRVAIVMAGNIPLVGFHDFLSVLITGHKVLVKQSTEDSQILPYLAQYLQFVEPNFKNTIEFTEGKLLNYDAVIATGSNNTARYFEYYFKDKPSIIRKNRNSVAVLTGQETDEQLNNLSEDIFRYYGLGCRNVSKLFVPKDYNFDAFFNSVFSWKEIIHDNKYANNYDYNKAVYLMSEFDILDNGFLMLKNDESYSSPIATLFYEKYDSLDDLKKKLRNDEELIQCIVADADLNNQIDFGQTQKPKLWDYADNVDTIEFLAKL